MMDARRASGGLGRGLAALIPPTSAPEPAREIPLDAIDPNPHQPRQRFDERSIASLVDSIAAHGVLQPVVVIEAAGRYQLVAGERRVRAARLAGLSGIPAVVRSADEQQQLALALVENIQRADLNAMDEARAFRLLIDDFGLTQDEVARHVGRSRPAVTNTLRLLEVDPEVQRAVEDGRISEGHARTLAGLETPETQRALLAQVVERALSVRQTERLVAASREPSRARPASGSAPTDPDLARIEASIREALGTRVTLSPGRRGGRITIAWFDDDDLARLVERLTGSHRP
jgi:ParB family transcriptional regulator, chromosome partitioning protein